MSKVAARQGNVAQRRPAVEHRPVLRLSRTAAPAIAAIAATGLFIGITIWWLTQDHRVPDFDPSLHTSIAFDRYDEMRSGDLLAAFEVWSAYPPFVHLVGIGAIAAVGSALWPSIVAMNLIFVPLLALGCYKTGRLVYGNAVAGTLAALFALGTPMVMSQFHVFMLDGPAAALVAVTLWLLLASDRFTRLRYAFFAGVAIGLGLLTKQSYPAFVAGVVLSQLLLRGGWRQWRGLLALIAPAILIAGPWYLTHLDHNWTLLRTPLGLAGAPDVLVPAFLSLDNASWYLWSGLKNQYWAPLLTFAAIGCVLALVDLVRSRRPPPLTLDLLVGGLVAWLAVSWQFPHDPRYSLPIVVYLAVLGTGWIVALPRTGRLVAQAALVLIVIANTLGASFGLGDTVRAAAPGGSPDAYLAEGTLTFYDHSGFSWGGPKDGGNLKRKLDALRAAGVRRVLFQNTGTAAFNDRGLALLARVANLSVATNLQPPLTRDEVVVANLRTWPDRWRPCVRLEDGTGVFFLGGDVEGAHDDRCPAR